MTPEQRAALELLVPADARGTDDEANLVAAVREALRRREHNHEDGGAVIRALRDDHGWTYREIADRTGLPFPTAQRWATADPEQ